MALLPRGLRNNNPLNIRKGNHWIGERVNQKDPAFEEFTTLTYGIRAALKLIRNYIVAGYNTPRKIIARWAPPIENVTDKYIEVACKLANLDPDTMLSPSDSEKIQQLVYGMSYVENGRKLAKEDIARAAVMLSW